MGVAGERGRREYAKTGNSCDQSQERQTHNHPPVGALDLTSKTESHHLLRWHHVQCFLFCGCSLTQSEVGGRAY